MIRWLIVAVLAVALIVDFAVRYYGWPGEVVHPMSWFMSLKQEARAAWVQALFSVFAIAVAAGIGLHQAAETRRVARETAKAENIRRDALLAAAKRAQMLDTSYLLMELAQSADRMTRAWAAINVARGVDPETLLGDQGRASAIAIGTMTLDRPLDGFLGSRDMYVPEHLESIRQADLASREYDRAVRNIVIFLSAGDVTAGQVVVWKTDRLEQLERAKRFSVEAIDAIAVEYEFRTYEELFAARVGQ